MNTEDVIVKTFNGTAKMVVVVTATDKTVFVTSKKNKRALEIGAASVPIIGFPLAEVYLPPPGINISRVDWGKCQPWQTHQR